MKENMLFVIQILALYYIIRSVYEYGYYIGVINRDKQLDKLGKKLTISKVIVGPFQPSVSDSQSNESSMPVKDPLSQGQACDLKV